MKSDLKLEILLEGQFTMSYHVIQAAKQSESFRRVAEAYQQLRNPRGAKMGLVLVMEEQVKGYCRCVTTNTLDVQDHKHRSAPLQRRAGSASASCLSISPQLSKQRV